MVRFSRATASCLLDFASEAIGGRTCLNRFLLTLPSKHRVVHEILHNAGVRDYATTADFPCWTSNARFSNGEMR